eukprot:COSAG06_NODE_38947_length_417_cov_40.761006_1_plen_40_part_01
MCAAGMDVAWCNAGKCGVLVRERDRKDNLLKTVRRADRHR